jgi:formylglycine-generating enzyme required for sulfatase activity
MNRVKTNRHYWLLFGLLYIGISIFVILFQGLLVHFFNFGVPFLGSLVALFSAMFVSRLFYKREGRFPEKAERKSLIIGSLLVWLAITFVFSVLTVTILFLVVGREAAQDLLPMLSGGFILVVIFFVILAIATPFQLLMIYLGYAKFGPKEMPNKPSKDKPLFEQAGVEANAAEDASPNWTAEPAPDTPSQSAPAAAKQSPQSDWQPPNDGFAVREERAPIFKYAVGALALLAVGGGAIWLASKVVIADEVPKIQRADNSKDKPDAKAPPPKSADDLAWVKALEIDTVEGYRAYIADFPNGRHVEDAQRLINEFDEEAWALAEERDTIAGYEDYLESWPEGLHVTEARERIAKLKAEEEARRKNAEEAARQEAAAWQAAAQVNTIPSYEGYLSKYPAGKNASEAQIRIERLRAEAARQQAAAADEAAWNAAQATGTADAYQQYLTSFPQGAHVPEAIAKLEELRPGPGKTFKDCATCPTMVSLPAGTAELGAPASDPKAKPNEKPARPVTFSNLFAIGVTEVTFAEYGACVAAGGCKSLPGDNGWGQGSRPVINVSCAFANGAAKESQLPWANEACTDLAADRTLPAGSLSKNGFGVADMIGNVGEWVLDCNTLNLRDAPVDGSADARGSCSQRIVRGGSWFSGPDDLRYSARAVQRRGDTNDFTGFRVVRN